MLIIPAIDLRGGRCVRLTQGDFDRETAYSDDPVAVARRWAASGAPWLHVVDLDGARLGEPAQLSLVAKIVAGGAQGELGGGLRTLEHLAAAFAAGVARAVVGTAAIEDPNLLGEAVAQFGAERIVLGVDARDGMVATHGWAHVSNEPADAVIQRAAMEGVVRVIYTDIARDGTLASPNYAAIAAVAALGLSVIASGGVAQYEHLERLAAIPGVEAAIVGKALYAGTLTLEELAGWRIERNREVIDGRTR